MKVFPAWVPPDLKTYVQTKQERLRYDTDIEERILTSPRVKRVWLLFDSLPSHERTQAMVYFLEVVQAAYRDAVDRRLVPELQGRIKAVQRMLGGKLMDRLISAAKKTEAICGADGPLSCNEQLVIIRDRLKNKLRFCRRSYLPLVHHFFSEEELYSLLNIAHHGPENSQRGRSDYVESFTSTATSIVFKRLFGNPYHLLAYDIALELSGKAAALTPEQKRDRVRKRRMRARQN